MMGACTYIIRGGYTIAEEARRGRRGQRVTVNNGVKLGLSRGSQIENPDNINDG